jgi:hypothetical protein
MASTYVNDLRLEEIGSGEQSTTWGTTTNTNLELIAEAFGYATEAITEDADTFSTTIADGATDPGRALYLKYTGTLDSVCTVSLLPNTVCKLWIIENATTGGYNISMKQGSGSEVVVPNGHVKVIYTDGGGGTAAVTDAFIDLNLNNLIIKNPATSSSPATLLLQTGDTDVAVNDVLGKLQFQAPDEGTGTDAILVAAEVAAVSEGDFSSSSNATKLSFRTGASEAATTAATEKMAISSVGNVTIKNTATGDDTPVTLLLQTGETDIAASDVLGKIQFQAPDEGTGTDAILVAAEVAAVSEGDFSSTSNATKLSFKTGASEAATEKMSLSSGGNLTVSGTYNGGGLMTTGGNIVIPDSGYIGSASDTDAVQINSAGNVYLTQGFRIEAGDTSLNSFYERGVIYMGRNQAGDNYTDMDGKGIIIYDDQGTAGTTFIRMLVANGTTAGDPVWQNKLSGTIKSEIEVSGDFLSATNSYASTSDARLKEHITDSGSQWNDIKAMRVRKYSFKEEKVDAPNMIGVIAQELESAGMGKLVKTHLESNPADDGGDEVPVLDSSGNQKSFKSVKYSVIHMKALKALQEAMERIEALEAKVASLGG